MLHEGVWYMQKYGKCLYKYEHAYVHMSVFGDYTIN